MKTKLVLPALFASSILFAAVQDNLLPHMRVYIHRPELFADAPFGSIPQDSRIPIPGLWYVRLPASTAHLYGWEALRELLETREIPGLDVSGQKDIFSNHIELLFRRDLNRELQRKRLHPYYKFRLLKLAGTGIDDKAMPSLQQQRDLEVLTLNDRITDAGLVWLKDLTGLRELGLQDSQATDAGMDVLKSLARLQRLDLRGTRVTHKGLAALASLPLEELQLGPAIGDEGVVSLASFRTLRQLELSQTQVTGSGLAALSGKLPLHTLFMGPLTTDDGLKAVATIRTLQRLDLTSARISNEGVRALEALPDVQELALTGTLVSDPAVSSLVLFKHLRFLEISRTNISLKGLQQLADLPSLEVVSFTAKETIDVADLRRWQKLLRLRTVIINGKPMNAEWMRKLKGSGRMGRYHFGLVLEAEAAEEPSHDLVHSAGEEPEVVQLVGLRLIHQVESDLDHVIPAPTMINVDNQQDSEKNFLGEIEVGVPAAGHQKKSEIRK